MAIQLHAETELTWTDVTSGNDFELFIGNDEGLGGFEVLIGTSTQPPTQTQLKDIHLTRLNKRNSDLVVGITFGDSIWLFGPEKDRTAIVLKTSDATRALQTCLDEPDTLAAYKRYVAILDAHSSTDMPGVRNRGLFANHHIRENVPNRKDWGTLTEQARPLARLRHRELIAGLGFSVSEEVSDAMVLCNDGDERRAVAVLLDGDETFENSSSRFPSSPVATGLGIAQKIGVPWLIVLRKEQIRLYPGRDGVGVGQKGQVETYLELDLATIDDAHLALLPLIFSSEALSDGGTTQLLLKESAQYAAGLGERLRVRVYEKVVPFISTAVAVQLQGQGLVLDAEGLQKAYSITLKLLFRLLFQAYAEDRGLLPAGRNERYDANSLKTIAQRDKDTPVEMFSSAATIWNDLVQVWDAIDEGSPLWQVPAYNGGLFGSDPAAHPEGFLIRSLRLPDSVLGPALQGLLIDLTDEGVRGPVDFRSLSVREFGTIYEGLLESSLSLAATDLTVDSAGAWVPAKQGDVVEVSAGNPYFHTSSGERKATGSYFTPKFVVDHLVEQAIDPTLTEHLARIKSYLVEGDHARASAEFFDYRVADLAMGSGHFLVAAVDRIEAHMRAFLAEPSSQVSGVIEELSRLRAAAKEALGRDEAAIEEIEDASLLRRQIARRCVYGVDVNPLAVELSRLALWIHTFVPGLPMSSLDHGLICGNSLTGIGSIDEALDTLIPQRSAGMRTLFDDEIEAGLLASRELLLDAANAAEANKAEVRNAAALARKARAAAEPTRLIFDAAVAVRTGTIPLVNAFTAEEVIAMAEQPVAKEFIESISPAHMPYLFPEVFLRERPGFDALLGNPPWEKVKVEEDVWWGVRIPGFRGKSRKEKAELLSSFRVSRPDLEVQFENEQNSVAALRTVIKSSTLEGFGSSGDPDLYQAFAWRNLALLRDQGRAGLVLPRGALSGAGSASWRKRVLEVGSFCSVIFAMNRDKWIFESVDGRQMVGFTVIEKSDEHKVCFAGPVTDHAELAQALTGLVEVEAEELASWSEGAKFPLLPDSKCSDVFAQVNRSPRFGAMDGEAKFRPTYELHASSDKSLMEFDVEEPMGRIPVWGGATYNIWEPSTEAPKAYAQSEKLRTFLTDKVTKAQSSNKSVYFGMDYNADNLPMDHARISFRMVTNSTNNRTVICCLIPPGVTTEHSAQLIVTKQGGEKAEAFLIGVMSSIPFDWVARRWVDLNVTFDILNDLPVPLYDTSNALVIQLINVAGRLAARDERYENWANAVGVPAGTLSDRISRENAIAEVDAIVGALYGLSREQLRHVFEHFHKGLDVQERLARTLEAFDKLGRING